MCWLHGKEKIVLKKEICYDFSAAIAGITAYFLCISVFGLHWNNGASGPCGKWMLFRVAEIQALSADVDTEAVWY